MYHQPILDVDDDDTRCPFFRNENQFVPRQEKLKKTRLSLRHAEVDVSLTAGRGTRWSERWHSDMPALCLPHPSSTAAGWQHRHNPATLSTFQHNLRLCFQEDREGRHTHWQTHTLTDTHTDRHAHTYTHTHCTIYPHAYLRSCVQFVPRCGKCRSFLLAFSLKHTHTSTHTHSHRDCCIFHRQNKITFKCKKHHYKRRHCV